jgi:hypothetical protein
MGSGKAGMLVPERSRWQAQVDGRDELLLIRVSVLSKQTDEQELVLPKLLARRIRERRGPLALEIHASRRDATWDMDIPRALFSSWVPNVNTIPAFVPRRRDYGGCL